MGLRNILSARVVVSEGSIEEIHVLADRGRPAKRIVRDVETALAARFGLFVDHRKVSVAQLDVEPEVAESAGRLVLTSLKVEIVADATEVHVDLMWGPEMLSGSSRGPRDARRQGPLAAEATLAAVAQACTDGVSVSLHHLETVRVGAREVCMASLLFLGRGHRERLLGSALVDADPHEPAVKATLDAVNRRLPLLVGGQVG